jgi:uncharacterized membrane protein YsdA (DUF1294 family)
MLGLLRLAILYLVIINVATFLVFLWDKVRAKNGEWRVKESTILLLAAIGGTPAAFIARALFRHKTRKQPFGYILIAIAVIQVIGVTGLIIYRTSSQVL